MKTVFQLNFVLKWSILVTGYFSEVPNQISVVDTIICAGFFLIYIMDESIHLLLERLGGDSSHQVGSESVLIKY